MKQLTKENRGPLGQRLFEARTSAVLSQQALADRIGITLAAYQRWETGKVGRPKPELLRKAAKVLHVDPVWLQTGRRPVKRGEVTVRRQELDDLRREMREIRRRLEALRPEQDGD